MFIYIFIYLFIHSAMHNVAGEWSLCRTLISGGEKIQIGDHRFEVIFAPV